jgi:hypothetical protein
MLLQIGNLSYKYLRGIYKYCKFVKYLKRSNSFWIYSMTEIVNNDATIIEQDNSDDINKNCFYYRPRQTGPRAHPAPSQ